MKFPYFVLAGVLATAVALPIIGAAQQAQPGGSTTQTTPASGEVHGPHQHGGMMRLLKGLNLSTDQQAKIKDIMTAYRQAHPQGSQHDPQAAAQMRDQIMAVLTPDQQAQLKAKMAQLHQGHGQGTPGTQENNNVFRPDASPSPAP